MGVACAFCFTALVLGSTSSFATYLDGPPFIRTGADVISRCEIKTAFDLRRCEGMVETIADQTEARRWRMKFCPPMVYTYSGPGNVPYGRTLHVIEQAQLHPEWLKLPAAEFVGRAIEAGENCPHK